MIQSLSRIACFCIGTLFLGTVAALTYQFAGRYLIGYTIRPNCVEIVALNFLPIRRIAYANIARVREVRFQSLWDFADPRMFSRYLFAQRFGNRIFGPAVVIELKVGISRAVFITPDDVPAFVAAVAERLPAAPPAAEPATRQKT
jgi:hypothetical protein